MKIKTYIINAFTDRPFKGNPAGVCLLEDKQIDSHIMQSIASELNLSETAFIRKDPFNPDRYTIRYFSPMVEVPFCGHATLAASKLILEKTGRNQVEFLTYFNLLVSASRQGHEIIMQFPLYDTTPYTADRDLLEAIGVNYYVESCYAAELKMLIIQVPELETLLNLQPDFARMQALTSTIRQVVVTARSSAQEYDFYSRCFCPWIGINEDPVTGSAHTVLARYWSKILNKPALKAYQASKRGGFMKLYVTGNSSLEVISQAQILLEGAMTIVV